MRKDRQAKRRGKERNERSLRVHREGPNVSFSPGRDGPVVYRMPTLTGVSPDQADEDPCRLLHRTPGIFGTLFMDDLRAVSFAWAALRY